MNLKLNQRSCELKSYDAFNAEMALIQKLMVEAKKHESTNVLKEEKRICKEFSIIAEMQRSSLAEGRKTKGNSK